jgi:hypothetical protein
MMEMIRTALDSEVMETVGAIAVGAMFGAFMCWAVTGGI